MRHNKLAGTRFLLGSRKHKPSTFTLASSNTDCKRNTASNKNNMLHSKSTYFYRWFSRSLDLVVSGLSTKKTNKISKTSKASYLVPAVCGAALLGAFCVIVNPAASKVEAAYAAGESDKCKTTADDNGVCAMELGIFMNGTDSAFNELPATELSTDSVVHRDYSFSIRAVDTKDGYDLYAGVVNTGSFGNSLVNADYPTEEHMIKALSGENVAYSNISNNEWGYALTSTNQTAEELSYNALPVATITNEDNTTTLTNGKLLVHGEDTGYDPSQPVGEDKHTDQDYKLYFAAKASPESPSGHYRTQVMLSLVANPKLVASSMQNFAAMGACSSKETNQQFQLVDDRTKSGLGKTTYWVAKLKDGKCWMTQNLDLALTQGAVLKPDDTDVAANYTISNLGDYKDPGMVSYKASAAVNNYASSSCGDPATTDCAAYFEKFSGDVNGSSEAHYLIGNYYPWTIAMAGQTTENSGSICPKGWKLPTRTEYEALINGVANTNATTDTIRTSPYYFVPAGYTFFSSYYSGSVVGGNGYYWTATIYPGNSNLSYFLHFYSNKLYVSDMNIGNSGGFSVRCVMR